MKQHILVISQYFYPEDFRINDICKEWVKNGRSVTVITGIPNYPQGRFFKGYGWFKKRREVYEGIEIIRLPIIARGKGSLRLALNYFSFVFSGFFWKLFTKLKADEVFIFEVSPMTQALPGIWYAKKRKIPCTIYVQDLWPENVEVVTGLHNKTIIGAIDKMVDYIYKHCHRILATSPSFVKKIEERASAFDKEGNSKVAYWPQYAEDFYRPAERKVLWDMPQDNSFKIVFTGNIGYAQGLDILPKTALLLKEKDVACKFVIIGDGRYREELEREIEIRGVQAYFLFLGRKKPTEIPDYLAHCNMAFVSFADNPLFEMTIPAKLQSYMACGMPILAVAGGETKRIVEEADCGICIESREPKRLAKVIETCMGSPDKAVWSSHARTYCEQEFDKKILMEKWETMYESVSD